MSLSGTHILGRRGGGGAQAQRRAEATTVSSTVCNCELLGSTVEQPDPRETGDGDLSPTLGDVTDFHKTTHLLRVFLASISSGGKRGEVGLEHWSPTP